MTNPVSKCKFCGHTAGLLCDGKLPDGTSCDNDMCRGCAGPPLVLACGRGRSNTRDLCPDCKREGMTV